MALHKMSPFVRFNIAQRYTAVCKINDMKRFHAIQKELAIAGVPKRILKSREAGALVNIMNKDEGILACIQGLYEEGAGLVIATTSRLLIVNKSFLWTRMEDESYAMVNSILYKKGIFFGKLILSTRARQYTFNVFKNDPIEPFISIIDNKMRQYGHVNL